jgi:hypothetical protein
VSESFLYVQRENDIPHVVVFPIRRYKPSDNLWDTVYCKHKDPNGDPIRVDHTYVDANWPRDGYTADDAKRYFDLKWDAYVITDDSVGEADPHYNCYSYAFGHSGYWLNNDICILLNDYTVVCNESNATVGIFQWHAVMIDPNASWQENGCWHVYSISHKDQSSAIFYYEYEAGWDLKLAPLYEPVTSYTKALLYKPLP